MENQKMSDDEQAIRQLTETWFTASKAGDIKTVLSLMTDDVVFTIVGQEPFGKEAFEALSKQLNNTPPEGAGEIKEIKIMGDWAFTRNYIKIKKPERRSGYTLTILHKESDGKWRIARDANLLTVDK